MIIARHMAGLGDMHTERTVGYAAVEFRGAAWDLL
jgi:hypothetical protein